MITFISNYFNTRVGMYRDGILQHEEHGLNAWSYTGPKRTRAVGRDMFASAADLLTLADVPFEWKEANPSWLQRRKHFPRNLADVRLA